MQGEIVPQSSLILLLDHDNIPFEKITLQQLVINWLDSHREYLPQTSLFTILIRAYGGWYSEETVTDVRFAASDFYQRTCPSVFFHAGYYCRMTFEFADSLAQYGNDEKIRITHTVIKRTAAQSLRPIPGAPMCIEPNCEIRSIKKWIRRKRACHMSNCPQQFSSQFQRIEQKQVDVHLAVDLLRYAESARQGRYVAVASDDSDLLPALVAAASRQNGTGSIAVIRFENKVSYLDSVLSKYGVRIIRVFP